MDEFGGFESMPGVVLAEPGPDRGGSGEMEVRLPSH